VAGALRRHGIDKRPRRPSLVIRLGAGEPWWLHHDEALPVAEIARRLRTHGDVVRARMKELGVAVRPPGGAARTPRRPAGVTSPDVALLEQVLAEAARRPPRLSRHGPIHDATPDALRSLHHDQGLGLTEIGVRLGCAPRTVRARWRRRASKSVTGVEPGAPPGSPVITANASLSCTAAPRSWTRSTTTASACALMAKRRIRRSISASIWCATSTAGSDCPSPTVALLTARSAGAVSRAIRHHGIEVRHRLPQPRPLGKRPAAGLDRDELVALAAAGSDAAAIAETLVIPSATTVGHRGSGARGSAPRTTRAAAHTLSRGP